MTLRNPRKRAATDPAAEPNVIPFIDVLLVLLIIFMVTAPKPTVDLRLEMARRSGVSHALIEPTVVALRAGASAAPALYVDDVEVAAERLAQSVLAHVLAANPTLAPEDVYAEAPIQVRSDQDIAYAHVVGAIDALQQAHFAKVALAAQRAEQ